MLTPLQCEVLAVAKRSKGVPFDTRWVVGRVWAAYADPLMERAPSYVEIADTLQALKDLGELGTAGGRKWWTPLED